MKKWTILFMVFLTMVFMLACKKKNNDNVNLLNTTYKIYYINTKTSEIVSEDYTSSAATKEELTEELMNALRQDPKNILYKKALPDNIPIKEFYFTDDDQLTINFDSSYSELKGISEVLCRATIVKTMSQIAGLEYVEFSVNGQTLMNSSGAIVGLMTKDDFIDSTGDETNYQLSLYYANEDGTMLKEYVTKVNFTGLNSLEESAVKQLINGPIEIGMHNTIPEGTTLLNVSTKEGICYVDFNEKFLDKITTITDEVAIYSVVNTLTELPNVNKVQFLINGETQKMYRESIPFDQKFEMKLDLIQGSK